MYTGTDAAERLREKVRQHVKWQHSKAVSCVVKLRNTIARVAIRSEKQGGWISKRGARLWRTPMVSLNRVVNALSLLAVAAGAASLESPTSPSTTRPSSLVATRRQYLPAGHAEYEFGPRQEKLFNTTMVAISTTQNQRRGVVEAASTLMVAIGFYVHASVKALETILYVCAEREWAKLAALGGLVNDVLYGVFTYNAAAHFGAITATKGND